MKLILDASKVSIAIDRLAYELIENHNDFKNTALIGIQPRGVELARRLWEKVKEYTGNNAILYGELDITFYRDDYRRNETPLIANAMDIDFVIEGKKVILIDDVLFTGRSIRSALDALNTFGRPQKAELLVLIDRRYSRELPIEADYTGKTVDSRADEKVKVEWGDKPGDNKVWLLTNK